MAREQCAADPRKTQSTLPFSLIFVFSTKPLMPMPANCSALKSRNVPPILPNAVRIPSTNTTSLLLICHLFILFFHKIILYFSVIEHMSQLSFVIASPRRRMWQSLYYHEPIRLLRSLRSSQRHYYTVSINRTNRK